MDYSRFHAQLSQLSHPPAEEFKTFLQQTESATSALLMQLLNLAVECLEVNEIYCQIGYDDGASLIGALLNAPQQLAYLLDPDNNETASNNLEQLSYNLSQFNLEEQIIFCQQSLEDFFLELRTMEDFPPIGVYFYNSIPDYRLVLLSLVCVRPFLAPHALIIINNTHWSSVQQGIYDFLATDVRASLLFELPLPQTETGNSTKELKILSWDVAKETSLSWDEFAQRFRFQPFIDSLSSFSQDFELHQKKQVLAELDQKALKFIKF